MKVIGWICTFVVFAFLSAIYSGYVLSVMWDWFIVSHFGLKALPIPFAIGLAMIISFTTKQDTEDKSEGNDLGDILIKGIVKALVKPSVFLFFGWIVTFFYITPNDHLTTEGINYEQRKIRSSNGICWKYCWSF